jgi:glycine/D-amino acid oxidase-like deaminating enzyme/nitrite reductase/ring-hydroxylating ferredoxin subunit
MAHTTSAIDTRSYWEEVSLPTYSALDQDIRVDVAVVGGGITGVTTAWLLAREGLRVALLDRWRVGGVDTTCTTAHLAAVTDTPLAELVSTWGRDHAQATWEAGWAAIDQIERTVTTEGIACEFKWVPGYLHLSPQARGAERDRSIRSLQQDAETAEDLGFDAELVEHIPLFDVPGVCFGSQARFHPRKYLDGLLAAFARVGGRTFEGTDAGEIAGEPATIRCGPHSVRADHVVLATHNPLVGKQSLLGASILQTRLALHTSYALRARVGPDRVLDACYWDTATPYHYLRVESDQSPDHVIFGGEDHKTGQEPDTRRPFERLERTLTHLLPGHVVTHRWSGQVIETPDGLPLIGEVAKGQWVATGFAGNGMTFGTLAAMIVSDGILGRRNPWRELFDVNRTRVHHGAWDYVKENTDYPYYLVRDRFVRPQVTSLQAVPHGEGRIVDLDRRRVAAFRRDNGSLVLRSAVCTHLGCIVGWNAAERTWDCPCHGSRFTPDGDVLAGPAESPLSRVSTRT